MKEKAVVLCSGGMDSCVVTAIALEKYDVSLLHLNYRQRTEERELKSFHDIANHYNISQKLIIDTSFLAQIGGSSLTDQSIEVTKNDLDEEEIPSSYVPFRNANILSMAVSWAETIKANHLFIGAVEEDGSGYPDCRVSFFEAFETMVNLGTKPETKIKIETPLIRLSKKEIVEKGKRLNAPLHLTWSCYERSDQACGECDSCLLRLRGFEQAGLNDPIPYLS
jgi:7-cyano-7-deazaguanine synthase